jgi:hypothetical protein
MALMINGNSRVISTPCQLLSALYRKYTGLFNQIFFIHGKTRLKREPFFADAKLLYSGAT